MLFYIQPLLVFHRDYTRTNMFLFVSTINCIKSMQAKLLEYLSKYLVTQVKKNYICFNYQTMLDNIEGVDSDLFIYLPQCLVFFIEYKRKNNEEENHPLADSYFLLGLMNYEDDITYLT